MALDDSLLRVPRPRSSLLEELDRAPTTTTTPQESEAPDDLPGPERLSPLPRPEDPYRAHSRADRRPVPTLRFALRDGAFDGFAYGDLRRFRMAASDNPGAAPAIVLRFIQEETTEVRIEGKNLDRLFDLVGHHKVSWIRELGFVDPKEAVVTRITITVRPT